MHFLVGAKMCPCAFTWVASRNVFCKWQDSPQTSWHKSFKHTHLKAASKFEVELEVVTQIMSLGIGFFIYTSQFYSMWIGCMHSHPGFFWELGIRIQVLMVSEQALTPSEPSPELPSPGRAVYSIVVRKANRQQQGRNFPLAPIFCFSRWIWHWGLGPEWQVMKDNLKLHPLFLNTHWVLGTESFIRSFLFGLSSWKLDKACHILGGKDCLILSVVSCQAMG